MLRVRVIFRISHRGLKKLIPDILPRLADQSGEITFDGPFWKKNVAIASAISSSRIDDGKQRRVCILTENNREFLSSIFGTWISGASAVPLSPHHPLPQLRYYVDDSESQVIIADRKNRPLAEKVADLTPSGKKRPEIVLSEDCPPASAAKFFVTNAGELFKVGEASEGVVLYTSGTTGKPKGVSLSMKNVATQVEAQAKAWKWSHRDVVLHTLPLYHTHGLVNAFLTPLFLGATVIMKPRFSEEEVLNYLTGSLKSERGPVTVFTGVPTMYSKMLDRLSTTNPSEIKSQFSKIRLLMSGSAPLSESLAKRWTEATGTELLERYGATETGMILTNPLNGKRNVGYVGMPFETVVVRLVEQKSGRVIVIADSKGLKNYEDVDKDDIAELQVSGPSVFSHYLNREKETSDAYATDSNGTKWYKTGDCASYSHTLNSFKINGRLSADIIKSGGYKISALDIETKLSEHPSIKECAVVGIADPKWGERVALVVQLQRGSKADFSLESLREWCKSRMPNYWTPTEMVIVEDSIPRNNMGKINKKELRNVFFPAKP